MTFLRKVVALEEMILLARTRLGSTQRLRIKATAEEPSLATSAALVNTKLPNLIELIPDILDRFRMYPIGLSADIEKEFLQISVTPEHGEFLKFFYPYENNEIVYRHCRLVFGVCSSPFLLAASINHIY
ncbi:uncharacterized protein TNIN_309571 [Trichonephila inaurata madagascariensis]|uniref:Uncharacterized protein n=1 Tax=Trichonephila inaurata madagascariensis TaxID=2747483 RepID=A0A8X6XEV3_9ARAC|nr:uncharacterized protein TNIN_309571 [Trichonephila inaurata madagascariensis]